MKKDQCHKQVSLAVDDARQECLKDSRFFTQEDLERAFERVREETLGTVRQELEMFYRMAGVFIQMLMFEAEQQSIVLRADVNYMENYKALEDIKDFEHLSLVGGPKKKVASKLPGLASAMMMNQEQTAETAALREENDRVKKMV